MRLPAVHPIREPMTEAEARRVGHAAHRIAHLRRLLDYGPTGATITIKHGQGVGSADLGLLDIKAVLALLIEREGAFLASFNVVRDPPLIEPRHGV